MTSPISSSSSDTRMAEALAGFEPLTRTQFERRCHRSKVLARIPLAVAGASVLASILIFGFGWPISDPSPSATALIALLALCSVFVWFVQQLAFGIPHDCIEAGDEPKALARLAEICAESEAVRTSLATWLREDRVLSLADVAAIEAKWAASKAPTLHELAAA